ncbi:triphosphoribosyl-dephospho-CoA synthase [Legionella maceachernii]|uniref:triphosphoribosyl-dephospho-CoA synthase n=1 Tax=Legionella maceachernii TaxID=466 RepID=A0A0W0VXH8_9GAMM|nr:triphosphoribosyl-dephospho-CoA synthase [Legionella maceachernii]KTD24665.1 2(5'-triphosphoribosyl)-3'-dephosphocoenzyme A synthase CitG [Legionella maceachernii]SKA26637.1 triphosphoribosyl-dephospho-CoA synthase [Legionella maceachernii]SUP01859.1 triphosphoribosyl-dephospho-CoA synthase [Legionella maceachernii]
MLRFQHSGHDPHKVARFYAKLAVRALYEEVALYPKPGLVSFMDNGAHQDMDGALFFRSLFGLRHYFFQVGLYASLGHAPQKLVRWGLQAEQIMYRITKGINTHRGAIFALGILCASCCKLSVKKNDFSMDDLHQAIIEDWATYLTLHHRNDNTHGAIVKEKYAVADAKQIAIGGYRLVFETYCNLQAFHHDKVFLGLLAYQRFLIHLDDINVLYRVGLNGLQFARDQIQKAISLDNREQSIQAAIQLHDVFSQQNISPGGVADLLSVLYFLHSIFSGTSL